MKRINCLVRGLVRPVIVALAALACAASITLLTSARADDKVPPASATGVSPGLSPDVPKEKQTTLGLYLTAKEAYEAWKANPGQVRVLDVRTPEEYLFVGHAEMAVNIPLALQSYEWDAERKHFAMKPNADFVAEVKKWAQPGDRILVMCRSGGRSARAVDKLAEAGFTNVYNIIEGMEGDLVEDPASPNYGRRTVNGWKNEGLPWTYAVDPERMRLPAGR
jgi:rhodanese-related sulfurtransferase